MPAKKVAKKQTKRTKQEKLVRSSFDVSKYNCERWASEKDFLEHVQLPKTSLADAKMSWQEAASIYLDHEGNMESLQYLANTVSQMLQQNSFVNSIRTRVKNPSNLLKKIVRKRIEKEKNITLENYKSEISDLVGVRVLHVLKSEWLPIHNSIMDAFKLYKNSTPVAYLTRNDESLWKPLYADNGCLCETNDRDYKSVHYDIEIGFTKQATRLEIQVRTINEEAWGELDHKINYPTPAVKVVGDFIRAANMLSSTADQLSQHIILVNNELSTMEENHKKLKSERDAALKETRNVASRLAKTKEDKARIEKALDDLESTLGSKVITNNFNQKLFYHVSPPLTLNVNSPSILTKALDTVQPLSLAYSHSLIGARCKQCNNSIDIHTGLRVCEDCQSKGCF